MPIRTFPSSLVLALLFAAPSAIQAQPPTPHPPPPVFTSIPAIPFTTTGPVIRAHAESEKPFTVAGEHGVLVGTQDGSLEAWVLPIKLLSHLTIQADIQGYSVPLYLNQHAAEIEVRPDRTIITYAHIGLTVRQIMFSPNHAPPGTGPVILFQFDCLHPTLITLRFDPDLRWMWPERNDGAPSVEWVSPEPHNDTAPGGFYVLHTDYPDLAAAVTIPGAEPGILAPYQERPHFYPAELKLHIDPARDNGRLFPLLMAVGTSTPTATSAALGAKLAELNTAIPALYQAHTAQYQKILADSVSIETPNKSLDEAFQWAETSIEQLKAIAEPSGETALVAGYYESGDSARPGFGWFFGRDALYTLYAVNSYGDFALARNELNFLIRRQRADGKIMHEYSQTAEAIDWRAFPYMYAAADSTPLFLMAVLDYVRSSGDTTFLTRHREAIEKAWAFETDPAHDTDHDGIYDNSQGTGWVESWPTGMPHQEIYLALLDQQASAAMAQIESLLHDPAKSELARKRAEAIAKTINREYSDPEKGCYAFSRNMDGSQDRTTTVYPALAWWSNLPGTSAPNGDGSIFTQPNSCLSQFPSATLNTDWGLRDVANNEKFYDGMSYHQGSVWPLFTGWAALAEYRANQPLAGYRMLMENANLTRAQDLGAVTELLSGDFYVPFGRSTSHQLWSSAMVITPILRGLFGISIDAQTKTITVNPHLPANWDHAKVENLQIPGGTESLEIQRVGQTLNVALSTLHHGPGDWNLRTDLAGAKRAPQGNGFIAIDIPLPILEVFEGEPHTPQPGSRTKLSRVLSVVTGERKIEVIIEGPAGSEVNYFVSQPDRVMPKIEISNGLSTKADAAHPGVALSFADSWEESHGAPLTMLVVFPPGAGWKTITVTLTW